MVPLYKFPCLTFLGMGIFVYLGYAKKQFVQRKSLNHYLVAVKRAG